MNRSDNPFLGNQTTSNQPDETDTHQQAAADLVRAKLAAIYGQPDGVAGDIIQPQNQTVNQQPQPVPNSSNTFAGDQPNKTQDKPDSTNDYQTFKIPHSDTANNLSSTGMLYQREQNLQNQINHGTQPVSSPDHELPPAQPHYELPQAATTQQSTQSSSFMQNTPQQDHPQPSPIQQPPASVQPQQPANLSLNNENLPKIAEQLSSKGKPSRQQAIKQFAKQAEIIRKDNVRRFKFWSKDKKNTKQPAAKTKRSPMLRTALLTALILVLYNNQLISGQINYYISPGEAIVSPQIIDPSTNNSVGPEPLIIIPKINVQVPTVYGVDTRNDDVIQDFLEQGVVHYARTAEPGQIGNTVILGHSSNSFWNGGQHKNAFSLLDRLDVGDTYMIHFEGKRYVYEIFNKEVIEPTDFRAVSQETDGLPISTLITCTPPGTSWKRLIIQAEQISPDPLEAEKVEIKPAAEDQEILAGNTSSLWDNIRDWLFE